MPEERWKDKHMCSYVSIHKRTHTQTLITDSQILFTLTIKDTKVAQT